MEKEKSLPIVSRETIEEHTKEINKAKKSKLFKSKSNKIFNIILKENPELSEIILPTLESKKSDEYKKGYLAGFTTIYDILKREIKKDNANLSKE